jgi:hypothetical protein
MVFVLYVHVFLPAAGRRQRRILPPPLPQANVFIPVFLPAAHQPCASKSTLHPTAATATHNLHCHCRPRPRPRPCSCCLLTSRINIASFCRHCLAQSLLLLLSSPPPVDVDIDVAFFHRHCLARWSSSLSSLSSSPLQVDVNLTSYRHHGLARLSLSLSSSLLPVNVARQCQHCILPPPPACAIFIVVVAPIHVPVPAACQ